MVTGHSLGEFTALVAAGAIDFGTCVDLVRFRGQAMQEAVPAGTGAMAALLGLEDADVEAACARSGAQAVGVVEAVNFNSPGQVVIAGEKAAVLRAIEAAKARGAKRAHRIAGQRAVAQQPHEVRGRAARRTARDHRDPRAAHPLPERGGRAGTQRARRHPRAAGAAVVEPGALDRDRGGAHQRRRQSQSSNAGPGGVLAGLVKRITRGGDTQTLRARIIPNPSTAALAAAAA